jgi:hypothetical protein
MSIIFSLSSIWLSLAHVGADRNSKARIMSYGLEFERSASFSRQCVLLESLGILKPE